MKISIVPLRPRNPMVAPARFRHAGVHQSAVRSPRQQARRALKRELDQMNRSP